MRRRPGHPSFRQHSRLATTLFCLVALCISLTTSLQCFAQDNSDPGSGYHLGEGFQIPDTGFRVGGFVTGTYDKPDSSPSRAAVDNFSLFLWWEGEGRLKFFSELEYDNFQFTQPRPPDETGYLSLERAYFDYSLTDSTDVRIGKFLTPIGRWNLVHAPPLVWTTSRPLVTTLPFPTNMTGIMVNGALPNIGNGIEYNIYASSGNELWPNPSLDLFSSAFGAHVAWTIVPGMQLGFSYADFEQEQTRPQRKVLTAADFLWTHDRFELSAEALYRASNEGAALDERGGYVQFVAPLSQRLYGVVRYETYRVARELSPTQLSVVGLNFRILPTLVLKAEWVESHHNTVGAPDGLLTSINILF